MTLAEAAEAQRDAQALALRKIVSLSDEPLAIESKWRRAWNIARAALAGVAPPGLTEPGIGGSEETGAATAAGSRVATPGLKTDSSSGSVSTGVAPPEEQPK